MNTTPSHCLNMEGMLTWRNQIGDERAEFLYIAVLVPFQEREHVLCNLVRVDVSS